MNRFFKFTALSLLLVSLGLSSVQAQNISRVEGLQRVGGVNPDTGYPLFYEDRNGFRLALCSTFNNCFLGLPNPALPLHFPFNPADPNNNFPDESFFYAAESIMFGRDTASRAILTQALEGAFGDGDVRGGDQIVFSRVRIRIDDLILGETYKVTYPYGVLNFVAESDAGAGVHRGPGLSYVQDIGIEPGEFSNTLTGDIGPFLIPTRFADAAGNFVGPGIQAEGNTYISDAGGTLETVTGSPLGTNFFRIEGPGVRAIFPVALHCKDANGVVIPNIDCVQSDLFSVQGMVATNFGATINRSTYSKTAEGVYVNTWANSIPGQALLASVDNGPWRYMSEGKEGSYFIRTQVYSPATPLAAATAAIPQSVDVLNVGDAFPSLVTANIVDHLIVSAHHVVGGFNAGLNVTAQSSNIYDAVNATAVLKTGFNAPVLPSFPLTDDLADNGIATGLAPLGVMNTPYLTVRVDSALGGSAEAQILVSGETSGSLAALTANAGPDVSGQTGGTTLNLSGSNSVGPTNMSYSWSHNDITGLIVLNNATSAQANFATPTGTEATFPAGGKLEVAFTLTVTDPATGLTAFDVAMATIEHPVSLPNDVCSIVEASYKVNKERWVVSGNCDFVANQKISIYPGDAIGPFYGVLIGEAFVAPVTPIFWDVAPGNGTAPVGSPQAGADVLEERTYSHVWAVSERGSISSFIYEVK